jgi:hypothetical protein
LKEAHCSERIHNHSRKAVLAPHERNAIETVKNALFRFRTATYLVNASALGLAKGSERAIQRNIAEHSVGTYIAQQKKFITKALIKKRRIWAFKR